MAFRIDYKSSVSKDLRRLDPQATRRVIERLESALSADPKAGSPLSGEFRGLYKLRVGEYRVIYARTADGVLVLRIANRKDVYR